MTAYEVFKGSDGEATKEMYRRLETLGPAGVVALNLFRACKCSARAKVYRRRAHKDEAYGRKQWSMDNLCAVLIEHAAALGIRWGWKADPQQEFHNQVLYVEIRTGQVSFHTNIRGKGPEYAGEWDGVTNASGDRICSWCCHLLNDNYEEAIPKPQQSAQPGPEDANDLHQDGEVRVAPAADVARAPVADLWAQFLGERGGGLPA